MELKILIIIIIIIMPERQLSPKFCSINVNKSNHFYNVLQKF